MRSLEPDEAQRLVQITRTTRDRVRLRRARIVLASAQGRSAAEAAGMVAMRPQDAREVIHAFNEQGFAALDPKWSGADRRGSVLRFVKLSAGSRRPPPQQLGCPFTTWSLSKLVEYLAEHKSVEYLAEHKSVEYLAEHKSIAISTESVRLILRKSGSVGRRPRRGRPAGTRTSS